MTCNRCNQCRFWDQIQDDPTSGECHHTPPAPVFDEDDEANYLVSWPVTAYDSLGCAAFAFKDPEDDKGETDRVTG